MSIQRYGQGPSVGNIFNAAFQAQTEKTHTTRGKMDASSYALAQKTGNTSKAPLELRMAATAGKVIGLLLSPFKFNPDKGREEVSKNLTKLGLSADKNAIAAFMKDNTSIRTLNFITKELLAYKAIDPGRFNAQAAKLTGYINNINGEGMKGLQSAVREVANMKAQRLQESLEKGGLYEFSAPSSGDTKKTSSKVESAPVQKMSATEIEEKRKQFSRQDSFDEETLKTGEPPKGLDKMFTSKPVLKQDMSKLPQSVVRLRGKAPVEISLGGEKVLSKTSTFEGEGKVQTQNATKHLLVAINKMLGQEPKNLEKKAELLSNMDSVPDEIQNYAPYTADGKLNVDNRDILVLRMVTKEMAATGITPLSIQMQNYCRTHNVDPPIQFAIADQFQHVAISKTENGFQGEGSYPMKIQVDRKTVATISVTVGMEIDEQTGKNKVTVKRSNLTFEEGVSDEVKSHILKGLDSPLPMGVVPFQKK